MLDDIAFSLLSIMLVAWTKYYRDLAFRWDL